jgi:hypothetical protein
MLPDIVIDEELNRKIYLMQSCRGACEEYQLNKKLVETNHIDFHELALEDISIEYLVWILMSSNFD